MTEVVPSINLLSLPPEILRQIVETVDLHDLPNVSVCCRQLHAIVKPVLNSEIRLYVAVPYTGHHYKPSKRHVFNPIPMKLHAMNEMTPDDKLHVRLFEVSRGSYTSRFVTNEDSKDPPRSQMFNSALRFGIRGCCRLRTFRSYWAYIEPRTVELIAELEPRHVTISFHIDCANWFYPQPVNEAAMTVLGMELATAMSSFTNLTNFEIYNLHSDFQQPAYAKMLAKVVAASPKLRVLGLSIAKSLFGNATGLPHLLESLCPALSEELRNRALPDLDLHHLIMGYRIFFPETRDRASQERRYNFTGISLKNLKELDIQVYQETRLLYSSAFSSGERQLGWRFIELAHSLCAITVKVIDEAFVVYLERRAYESSYVPLVKIAVTVQLANRHPILRTRFLNILSSSKTSLATLSLPSVFRLHEVDIAKLSVLTAIRVLQCNIDIDGGADEENMFMMLHSFDKLELLSTLWQLPGIGLNYPFTEVNEHKLMLRRQILKGLKVGAWPKMQHLFVTAGEKHGYRIWRRTSGEKLVYPDQDSDDEISESDDDYFEPAREEPTVNKDDVTVALVSLTRHQKWKVERDGYVPDVDVEYTYDP